MGDKNLNEILKNKNFNVVENDIFYKEGIIEYLEINNNLRAN